MRKLLATIGGFAVLQLTALTGLVHFMLARTITIPILLIVLLGSIAAMIVFCWGDKKRSEETT